MISVHPYYDGNDPEAPAGEQTCHYYGCDIPEGEALRVRGKLHCRQHGLVALAQIVAPLLDPSRYAPIAEVDEADHALPEIEELLSEIDYAIRQRRAGVEREQRALVASIRGQS